MQILRLLTTAPQSVVAVSPTPVNRHSRFSSLSFFAECNRIKQVQVDLSIDQERRVFVNVSWLGNHSPEDVLEVTVKRARNDRNAKYCIPETEVIVDLSVVN